MVSNLKQKRVKKVAFKGQNYPFLVTEALVSLSLLINILDKNKTNQGWAGKEYNTPLQLFKQKEIV